MTGFDGALFALGFSADLGNRVAEHLGVALSAHEERDFDGGEHKSRSLVGVRGRDCHVIASLAGDQSVSANDRLCRLLFFIGALKEASARSVTAVVPYLCYSRKDRQTKARDPVTTRYVAQLFEAVGTDRIVTLDVHNVAAFQNASRIPTDHLEATQLFVEHVGRTTTSRDLVVVSPDIGGVKRAERFRQRLAEDLGIPVELAFTAKHRSRGVLTGSDRVLGQVDGRVAIVIDDMISSGGTMRRVAEMLVGQGAASVVLMATHGLFTPGSLELFDDPAVTQVVVTDSVDQTARSSEVTRGRLVVLGTGSLLAEAVGRIDRGGSISELLRLEN